MTEMALTRERILEAAEDVLRRFGPSKATVVDVARVLGVSHGSVYRHFASKAKLRDAVTQIWLARISDPLEPILSEEIPAAERLYRWLRGLIAAKRRLLADDPELFATYVELGRRRGRSSGSTWIISWTKSAASFRTGWHGANWKPQKWRR